MRLKFLLTIFASCSFITANAADRRVLFNDTFSETLKPGWEWVREDKDAWRVKDGSLQIQIQPGNMWGPENSARNVLVRDLPESAQTNCTITVTVKNRPTEQYEQVDLVWYYNDSNMVKIGQEQVDGKLTVVMGREEGDRTRTIAIVPIAAEKVQLKFQVAGEMIQGYFRESDSGEWRKAGECTKPGKAGAKVSIQCYQGPRQVQRWANIDDFEISQ